MRRLAIFVALAALTSCTRRDLSDVACGSQSSGEVADIQVTIDWSQSGFETDEQSKSGDMDIHRVSLRFFPTDGSTPFDRYLEGDVQSGVINVPIGEYSVVIFNESIYDPYWSDAIVFEDVDSYELFAAEIVDQDAELYDFYSPADDERLSVEVLQLSSCSIDSFVVTEAMCTSSQEQWSDEDIATAQQLNPATPRRLTCSTTIEVDTENLASAYYVYASLTGLAHRVFMASGETDNATTTHVGELTQRSWHDEEQQHGVIYQSRLTFSTPATTSTHTLTLDVILTNGSRHSPVEEMAYDVSDQILKVATRYADDDLGASVSLSLPEVSGDVEVEDWDDDNIITIL